MVLVAVQLFVSGIVSPASVQIAGIAISAPDDHFTAGPHCRVTVSGRGRIGGAGGCPTVRARDCIFRQYSKSWPPLDPPQMIISLPVHTAV